MRSKKLWLSFFLLAVTFSVNATPITYIYTGTGSGTIGGSPFTDASFTFTATADTDDIVNVGVLEVDHITTNATINGSTYAISTALRTYKSSAAVGLSRSSSVVGGDLYNTDSDPAFSAWDMTTSLGPITTTRYLIQWDSGAPIETDGGTLIFDTGETTGTFEAILGADPVPTNATPIPTLSWFGAVVLVTLLAGLAYIRRKTFVN
jgi:hypothetical protein